MAKSVNEEKRRVVDETLRRYPGKGTRELADLCNVSHSFVAGRKRLLREELAKINRQGRDANAQSVGAGGVFVPPGSPMPRIPEPHELHLSAGHQAFQMLDSMVDAYDNGDDLAPLIERTRSYFVPMWKRIQGKADSGTNEEGTE